MTLDQFRNEEGLRAAHAEYLRSPTGMIMLGVLREMARAVDVPSNADALASARVLAQFHGYGSCIDDICRMGEPSIKMADLPATFGADNERGDQLELQVHWQVMKEMQDARIAARNATADAAAARPVQDS